MDYQKLVDLYQSLEDTSSGNKTRELLAEFFKKIPPDELAIIAYLTLGRIASDYDGIVLGLAEKMVLKSISIASGSDLKRVAQIMKETGDVGLTAEKVLQKKPQTLIPMGHLTVKEFHDQLLKMADLSGSGSQETKTTLLAVMLKKASPQGAKYLTRTVLGTLRMGVGEMAVLDALAIAFTGDKKNKEILEIAYNICPDVGIIAETLTEKGLKGIEKIDVHVGRPIKMMLCQRVKSLEEVKEKIPGEVTVEGKYDGERIQAHKTKAGKVILFSRRLDNITEQFPDLVQYLNKAISEKEYVIEGEVIAIDGKGHPLPFQTLMQRRRKYDIEKYAEQIPLQLKLFDLLYLNGQSLLNEPFHQRTKQLAQILHPNKEVVLTDRIITDQVKEIDDFFHQMLKAGYEGIIIKSRAEDSVYQAGVRGWNWIKWKKEYTGDLSDTFDLVIIGAYHGKGRRSGAYGALLCAVYNEKKDQFETFCKLGTGLSDELLAELPVKLKPYLSRSQPQKVIVSKEMIPEIWFEPKIVVEVLGAEITNSPFHTSGLALRFPRFVRFRDKKPEQATTTKELEQLQ